MTTQLDRVLNTLESGGVTRYHSNPHVDAQTDAEHAWGVAVILMYITEGHPTYLQGNLIREALLHDSGELLVGDIPHSTKVGNPQLGEILRALENTNRESSMIEGVDLSSKPREYALLKIADCLEAMYWCGPHSHYPVHNPLMGGFRDQYNDLVIQYHKQIKESNLERCNDLASILISRIS